MSGLPPLSAEPGTPASEWAAKTTTALQPNPSTPLSQTMNPTTKQLFEEKNLRYGTTADAFGNPPPVEVSRPGQDMPGAFPNREELQARGQEVINTASETATKVAQTVQETAATYLPMAAETVGSYLPKSVVDTMSGYIPGMTNPQGRVVASEHDHLHTQSLPSTELTGHAAGEHVEGAGALPGPVTESGVTKLPDERHSWQIPTAAGAAVAATATAGGAAASVKNTVYGTAEQAKEKSTAIAPGPVSGLSTAKYSMPSQEEYGAKSSEHVDGVGALPGKRTEAGVATFPGENTRGATNATSASVGTHGRAYESATLPSQETPTGVSGGVGTLPGKVGEEGVAMLPDERTNIAAASGTAAFGTGVAVASLPSRETIGAQPGEHSGGAGALPGSNTEPAVAVPPDAKHGASKSQHGSLDKHVGEDAAMAAAAKKASVDSQSASSKPTQSQDTKQEKPKESHVSHGKPNQASSNFVFPLTSQPRRPLPDARSDRSGAASQQRPAPEHSEEKEQSANKSELRGNMLIPTLTPRMHILGTKDATLNGGPVGTAEFLRDDGIDGDGYDTDYHPSQLHPLDANYSKEHAEQESEKEPVAEKDSEKPLTGTSSATDHDDDHKAKKAGFMAKMKGEAKILIGKMEGKKGHEKVEEGQRIKAGEPVQ